MPTALPLPWIIHQHPCLHRLLELSCTFPSPLLWLKFAHRIIYLIFPVHTSSKVECLTAVWRSMLPLCTLLIIKLILWLLHSHPQSRELGHLSHLLSCFSLIISPFPALSSPLHPSFQKIGRTTSVLHPLTSKSKRRLLHQPPSSSFAALIVNNHMSINLRDEPTAVDANKLAKSDLISTPNAYEQWKILRIVLKITMMKHHIKRRRVAMIAKGGVKHFISFHSLCRWLAEEEWSKYLSFCPRSLPTSRTCSQNGKRDEWKVYSGWNGLASQLLRSSTRSLKRLPCGINFF